jgi:hypothetical protein
MTSAPSGVRPVSHRIMNEVFYRAVAAAGRAPSAYNAQPWRWRVSDGVLDLFLHHARSGVRAGTVRPSAAAFPHGFVSCRGVGCAAW